MSKLLEYLKELLRSGFVKNWRHASYSIQQIQTSTETAYNYEVVAPYSGYVSLNTWGCENAAIINRSTTSAVDTGLSSGNVWGPQLGNHDFRCFVPCSKGDSLTVYINSLSPETITGKLVFIEVGGSE